MLERTMKKVIEQTSKGFPVLLLTGQRQIGKTTLLESMASKDRRYVSLDDLQARNMAKNDPSAFIQQYEPPVIIDEVQYAPELFTYIKIHVDQHKLKGEKPKGAFWLTGSQQYRLMEGIQESLAGRVAILDMLGLSYKEIIEKPFAGEPFWPSMEMAHRKPFSRELSIREVYEHIWNGSFPQMLVDKNINRKLFYSSYIQTYISRDIKDFYNITNELAFHNFLVAVAARTGQLLNYTNLANDVDIDLKTAKHWLSILERTAIIQLLRPYSPNVTKRIVKTPKVYFLDTGLASYLTNWDSPDSLMAGAMNGQMLETWVFGEILKSFWHNGDNPAIYFYRDTNQKEIDFVLEKNMTLYPIEVKKSAMPSRTDLRHFKVLETLGKKVGTGAVLCLYPTVMPLGEDVISYPVWEI
ncbi:ATPase [Spirochaetia bacterium]|nr:ATPase [Spirochaetia bacterium]